MAFRSRPGSAYVSLAHALEPLDHPAAEGRRNNRFLDIQILVPVQDSEGRPVGVLVANVLTRQLLWLLQDLNGKLQETSLLACSTRRAWY